MRRTSMPPPSDLPSFLYDSPFLPTFNPPDEHHQTRHPAKRNPTIRELLNSKPTRRILSAVFALIIFFYLLRHYHVWTRLTGPSCALQPTVVIPISPPIDTDWSRFAYMQYATNLEYLCNSIMIFETLHRLGSKADRLLLYPSKYSLDKPATTEEGRLLLQARDGYGVKLQPIEVLHEPSAYWAGPNWADSYTKLLAFNQTRYSRLIVLDSDASILSPMDTLFFIPPTPAAMPLAWWLPHPFLSSHIMVIQPSSAEFKRVQAAVKKARVGTYDMEIMNNLYGRSCVVLPREEYALLTGELREEGHGKWLRGGGEKRWDPQRVREMAKYVHFSDDPLPKPWLAKQEEVERFQPGCFGVGEGLDCQDRDFWMDLYRDFGERRERVCGI